MPAKSKRKQLALAVLSIEKKALSPSQLAGLIGDNTDKNTINLMRHYLLEFWKKKNVIRSEREIGLEYYYFFGAEDPEITINGHKIKFVKYTPNIDSRNLKTEIKKILHSKGPLTVKGVCAEIKQDFDLTFQKKINFHLQELYNSKELFRASKPYQYYITKGDQKKISKAKASIPSLLLLILHEKKTALFTSELIYEIKNISATPKLSAVSLALQRLCRQQKIISSSTKFGTRSRKTGYIWAVAREQIRERFRQELPLAVQKLLHTERITLREVCTALKISPANAQRWMERLAHELPEWEMTVGNELKRK